MTVFDERVGLRARNKQGAVDGLAVARSVADRLDGQLAAFATRFGDVPASDSRLPSGLLQDLPVAVKDLIFTAEAPTKGQSDGYRSARPSTYDGTAVARLRAAGAVVVGKTTTMELGAGLLAPGISAVVPRNPWDPGRWPGGSSSGSAIAVATGMAAVALGTDTGGSIRCPAALCGVTGFVPTHGTVPMDGMIMGGESYETIGPMARSAAECQTVLRVLRAEPASNGPDDIDLRSLRIGVMDLPGTHPDVASSVAESLAVLAANGAHLEPVVLREWADLGAVAALGTICEHFATMAEQLAERWESFGEGARRIIAAGAAFSARDYLVVQRARGVLARRVVAATADLDFVCLPTTPTPSPPFGELDGISDFAAYTSPINALGWPAISIPVRPSTEGLPVGLQIVGKPHADHAVLALAHHYQTHTAWHRRCPPLAGSDSTKRIIGDLD